MKYRKETVDYTDDHGSSNEQCSKCFWFRKPRGCKIVIGSIDPGGWCNKYVLRVGAGDVSGRES